MEKVEITVMQLLTLIGPNTLVRIIDDTIRTPEGYTEEEIIRAKTIEYGVSAKVRNSMDQESTGRLVKHLSPISEADNHGRYIFRIYIF